MIPRTDQKIEFITNIYILYYRSSINFQFPPNFAVFPDTLYFELNQTQMTGSEV